MMSKEAIAHYEAALKEAFPRGATGEVFHHWNEARYLIATEALDKMAENARELGLDYDVKSDHRLMEQPAQQEPDELRHIGEQDCLLDVDEKAWRSLVENRGGCRCHISPPCGACSNPISEEEMNEVGYTYTLPQPAQQEPVAFIKGRGWRNGNLEVIPAKMNQTFEIDQPLYTSPPAQRTWVDLTGDEIVNILPDDDTPMSLGEAFFKFAELVEAKLKEKNNG